MLSDFMIGGTLLENIGSRVEGQGSHWIESAA